MKRPVIVGVLLLLSSSMLFAASHKQGGDIKAGHYFNMQPGDMISYYKDGRKGQVTFTCKLWGNKISAALSPGKNFEGNSYAVLQVGKNGPYTWHLRDNGYNNGNIRISLLTGTDATLQCIEI